MEIFKKAMLMGLGMMNLTKEKAEALAEELIKKGEIAKEEKFKIVDKLLSQAQEQEKELMKKFSEIIKKTITEMGIPTKEDIEKVLTKLDEIEKKIS